VTAADGGEALEMMDGSVSVVLLDRRMPGMSGSEVLAEIRDAGYDTRVALVTAVEPDFDVIGMGFDAYLVKPVTREELVGTVRELLRRSEYAEKLLDYHSLVSKKSLLEAEKPDAELAESDGYRELLDRLREVESEVDELSRTLSEDGDGFKAVVRDIQGQGQERA
jgi:DNA-binding response OmpR family regulator